jgi:hypothetical protein
MKVGVLLRWILLVGSISFVSACGSGGSQFAGGRDSGSFDATIGDGPKLMLGGGTAEATARPSAETVTR